MSRETYRGEISAATDTMQCVIPGVAFLHVALVYLISPDLLHGHPLGQQKVKAGLHSEG